MDIIQLLLELPREFCGTKNTIIIQLRREEVTINQVLCDPQHKPCLHHKQLNISEISFPLNVSYPVL